jgi:hypothetical protein
MSQDHCLTYLSMIVSANPVGNYEDLNGIDYAGPKEENLQVEERYATCS